jgi:hypothetical protein
MSIAAIALFAALSAPPAPQEDGPRAESRSEIRIVTMGGPDGHGPGRLDADGDGVVTREEFSAPMATAFDRMDADHDGRLTTEELAAGHGEGAPQGHRVRVMRMGGPDGPGGHPMMFGGEDEGGDAQVFMFRREGGPEGGPHPGPGGPGERRVEIRRFGGPEGHASMDTNNDGKVSEEEFLAPMREAFQSMDADHDGALDDSEAPHGPPPPPHAPPAPPAQAN